MLCLLIIHVISTLNNWVSKVHIWSLTEDRDWNDASGKVTLNKQTNAADEPQWSENI